jgi:dATP pyrophosphohydrolase
LPDGTLIWDGTGRAPFQVLVIPFRHEGAAIKYAIFRRADAGYWQFIAGGGEGHESPIEAARREAFEEAAIPETAPLLALDARSMVPVLEIVGCLRWGPDTLVVPEYAFGVRVAAGGLALSAEHTACEWVDFDACRAMLHWESNRIALDELNQRLIHGTLTDVPSATYP